jgi:pimeloyl-ACP methyl ester carboxylesterase
MSTQQVVAVRDHEWFDYYHRFSYFSPEMVRDGCHPRIMEHAKSTKKAIVLVHGLSDSPYFMTAIGDYFFNHLGYNVYMPLLHCHGLKDPNGMEGVELEEWKANVSFAINTAARKSNEVSIGGLSTGGTLSLYMAAINPKIRGTLYLFSAALDLAGGPFGLIGELKEKLLLTFLADLLDFNTPLIGENPYRYSSVDMDGAVQLARLIKETDIIIEGYDQRFPFPEKVFAVHSESDTTADIAGIEALRNVSDQERFNFFKIARELGVPHASVVLETPIEKDGKVLEPRNPKFPDMMQAIAAFETIV